MLCSVIWNSSLLPTFEVVLVWLLLTKNADPTLAVEAAPRLKARNVASPPPASRRTTSAINAMLSLLLILPLPFVGDGGAAGSGVAGGGGITSGRGWIA